MIHQAASAADLPTWLNYCTSRRHVSDIMTPVTSCYVWQNPAGCEGLPRLNSGRCITPRDVAGRHRGNHKLRLPLRPPQRSYFHPFGILDVQLPTDIFRKFLLSSKGIDVFQFKR
jgi:hypothetical protein